MDKKDKKPKQPFIDEVLDYCKVIVCTVLVFLLINTFIAREATVNGASMQPTLQNGDFLILRSIFYTPEQGDIIACNAQGLGKVIVKRISCRRHTQHHHPLGGQGYRKSYGPRGRIFRPRRQPPELQRLTKPGRRIYRPRRNFRQGSASGLPV